MNLILSFVHPSRPPRTVGPFAAVRLDGESVREPTSPTPIARHREHQWEVEGERYFRLDATARVRIHFERPRHGTLSRPFGPFERFSAIDGITYTDDRVFAFVDPRMGDWFCYADGQHWPVMVVSDASGAARNRLGSLAVLAPLLAGVIALWKRGRLLYVGRAASLRERLQAIAADPGFGADAVTWEAHPDPASGEAELLAAYQARYTSLCSSA